MKKSITITTLLAALLLIVGCGGPAETTYSSPYFGGSQGVVASFEPVGGTSQAATTNVVFEGETFPVDIQVQNKGEYTIPEGHLVATLKGINVEQFGPALNGQFTTNFVIERVSEFLPEGGVEYLNFGDAQFNDVAGTFFDANFFAEIDYHYQTVISMPQVCFKQDLRDERICDVTQPNLPVYSSGAPIIATAASQKPAGEGRIMIEIEIANAGTGKARVDNNVPLDPRYDEVSFQLVSEDRVGAVQFDCTSRGERAEDGPATARLSQGAVFIRCRSESLPEDTLFTGQVDLLLDYWYQDIIGQTITIQSDIDAFDNS